MTFPEPQPRTIRSRCGHRMPIAQELCARPAGHSGAHLSASALERQAARWSTPAGRAYQAAYRIRHLEKRRAYAAAYKKSEAGRNTTRRFEESESRKEWVERYEASEARKEAKRATRTRHIVMGYAAEADARYKRRKAEERDNKLLEELTCRG